MTAHPENPDTMTAAEDIADQKARGMIPEDAIWPKPEGETLGSPNLWEALTHTRADLDRVEQETISLLAAAPVKADDSHPMFVHDLAFLVDHLEHVIDKAKAIQAEAGEHLAKAVPFGTPRIAFPGLRPLTPRWGGNRTAWANDLLAEHVRPRILMADPEAAEMRSPGEVLDLAFSVVSLNGSNVKVTGLRALGLDPDDYCRKSPAPPSIQVTKDAIDR